MSDYRNPRVINYRDAVAAGCWIGVAEMAAKDRGGLTLFRFGRGWKALFGIYSWEKDYEYLHGLAEHDTVEAACRNLVFRDRAINGVLGVEVDWEMESVAIAAKSSYADYFFARKGDER